MLGFVWGAHNEFQTGELMLSQAQHLSIPAILACLLFTYATMVPVMHSARMEPFGPFTPSYVSTFWHLSVPGVVPDLTVIRVQRS